MTALIDYVVEPSELDLINFIMAQLEIQVSDLQLFPLLDGLRHWVFHG